MPAKSRHQYTLVKINSLIPRGQEQDKSLPVLTLKSPTCMLNKWTHEWIGRGGEMHIPKPTSLTHRLCIKECECCTTLVNWIDSYCREITNTHWKLFEWLPAYICLKQWCSRRVEDPEAKTCVAIFDTMISWHHHYVGSDQTEALGREVDLTKFIFVWRVKQKKQHFLEKTW